MKPLYRSADIRAIEHAAAAALPEGELMRRAGRAAAAAAQRLLSSAAPHPGPVDTFPDRASALQRLQVRVLVLAGPGNNLGDALEAAAHLADAGISVTVLHSQPGNAQSPERAAAWRRAADSSARFEELSAPAVQTGDWQLVIDGLFGIGLARPIGGALRALVDAVNQLPCPVLALDVPSGLDADTGAIVGPDGIALRASHTITFIGDKPGLHTNEGRDHAGIVEVAHLDIDPALLPTAELQLNRLELFARYLHARRHSGHKGTYGNVAVIGGATGMRGAPILSARAALHAGAGRVYVLFPEDPLAADSGQPELMCRLAEGYDFEQATLAIGPGLGDSATAADLLARAIVSQSALLVDADALNLLAHTPALQRARASRGATTAPTLHALQAARPVDGSVTAVLTPHPLEAARLLAVTVAAVQADRVAAARTLAARLQAVVVLKGSGTVIAAPGGDCVINPTGNPALATAGTGDVLSGLCAALLAQGCPPWPAALAAVWLHGAAADELVASGVGPIGMTAGELIPAIRAGINRLARLNLVR